MIETKMICDSIGEHSPRLSTMLWRYPKFVHQESLRHRKIYFEDQLRGDFDFSFSVSSARAIPFVKLLEEVRNPKLLAYPEKWGIEQKGMSPGNELKREERILAERIWQQAAIEASEYAEQLAALGVHKSICNRIIEPYIHVNCLATATAPGWMNFFGLRLDKAADPTLRALAEAAWRVWNESKPNKLEFGGWHLPFIDPDIEPTGVSGSALDVTLRCSVARCARLSYLSFETGKRSTIKEDLELYDRLVGSIPIHASPAEHQATPDDISSITYDDKIVSIGYNHVEQSGNLGSGWRQYRKMLSGEALAPLPEGY